jgi:hypothetical protein
MRAYFVAFFQHRGRNEAKRNQHKKEIEIVESLFLNNIYSSFASSRLCLLNVCMSL